MPSGQNTEEYGLSLGDLVTDKDKDQTPTLVVVGLPDERIDEWKVPNTGKTVADFNENYDPGDPAVITVFERELSEDRKPLSNSNFEEIRSGDGPQTYSYPISRLQTGTTAVPENIETYHDLICYQWARMIGVASGKNVEAFVRHKYRELKNGEMQISSVERENKYQLKEGFGECIYCSEDCTPEFEHLVPVSKGGAETVGNQVPACPQCNRSKGTKNVIEWFKEEHGNEIPRLVFGKYLKQRRKQLEEEGEISEPVPDHILERWERIEPVREFSTRLNSKSTR